MGLETKTIYHYTNGEAFHSMETGFDYNRMGLYPLRRFAKLSEKGLPEEAHEAVTFALLNPEPESWKKNLKFPKLWDFLLHDICLGRKEIILLTFETIPSDEIFVVDRGIVENYLYGRKKTLKGRSLAYLAYWNSRVPLSGYEENFEVPEVIIKNTIEFSRLKVEWKKSFKDMF
jgi:hypothetical protein